MLMARLLHGSGMHLMECDRSRMKYLYFEYRYIVLRDDKGARARYTLLPVILVEPFHEHLIQVKRTHTIELRQILLRSCRLTKFL